MKFSGHIEPFKNSNRQFNVALTIILFFVFLCFIAPFLANERPILVSTENATYWPVFSSVNWQSICEHQSCKMIYPLIPFSPEELEVESRLMPPGTTSSKRSVHWLGTDELGRDVLATVVHGARTSLWVSVPAAGLALVFGLVFGLVCGYYGDDKVHISRRNLLLMFLFWCILIVGLLFWANLYPNTGLSIWAVVTVCILLIGQSLLIGQPDRKNRPALKIPLDSTGMRLVDLIKSLPPLFIVLFALQLMDHPGLWSMVFLIAYLLWATFARHSRAEVLRLRRRPSVYNALLTGRSDLWIWRNELLPYIVRPLLVTLAFSIASAILLEATLSFLGIGLPAEHVSWGTMINTARQHPNAWWLLVFPGMCLVGLIWSIQTMGYAIEKRLRHEHGMRSA